MLPRNHPDRIRIAFDDRHQASVNAGLLFTATRDQKHGVGLNHLPSGRFAANAAWLAVQVDRPQPGPLDRAHRSG